MMVTKAYSKQLMTWVKLGFTMVALYLIYLKLTNHDDLSQQLMLLKGVWMNSDKLPVIAMLYGLMMLNWFIEVLKWRSLLGGWVNVSLPDMTRAVFSGVTISLFTPNRVGEFAGRVMHLRKRDRVFGALSSIACSMNQLLITVLFGTIFLALLSADVLGISEGRRMMLVGICSAISLVFLYIYFNIGSLPSRFRGSSIVKKLQVYLDSLERFSRADLFRVTLLSGLRYVVFTTQYVLLLSFFEVGVSVFEMVTLISVMYLVTSIIPGFAISELALRGSVAMELFPETYASGVLGASVSIWLINIVSPAIIGAFAFLYIKIKR